MSKVVSTKYQNLVTGNPFKCIAYDGELLTLDGIGKMAVTFQIPWQMVLTKYREIKRGQHERV